MVDRGPEPASRRRFLTGLAAVSAAAPVAPARLLADTRSERLLSFVHTHTGERLTVPYFADQVCKIVRRRKLRD